LTKMSASAFSVNAGMQARCPPIRLTETLPFSGTRLMNAFE
jgi:hypothetical protein